MTKFLLSNETEIERGKLTCIERGIFASLQLFRLTPVSLINDAIGELDSLALSPSFHSFLIHLTRQMTTKVTLFLKILPP